LTPAENGVNGGTVNTTATIGGISGGASVGAGETFRVDFVKDLGGDPADTVGGLNYASIQNRDHSFDGHYTVNGATALFKSSNNSTIRITAFDDPDGNAVVGDGVIDVIRGLTISYFGVAGGLIVPTVAATDYTVNGHVFTVVLNPDGSVSVSGVAGDSGSSLQGTVIAIFTTNGYNSVEYSYQSGDTFQIGDFGATATSTQPVNFTVPVEVIDGDGDISSSSNLVITANPPLAISVVAPITLDANQDGEITYQALATSAAHFDYAGDGFAEQTAWVAAGDALLVYDYNHDGIANNGSEIAFVHYHPDATTDLEGLRFAFDTNRDLVFDAQDSKYVDFGIWVDKNGDGVTDFGEYQTLEQAGITGFGLTSYGVPTYAVGGDVLVYGQIGVSYSSGYVGLAEDVAFASASFDSHVVDSSTVDLISVAHISNQSLEEFPSDFATPDPIIRSDVNTLAELVEGFVAQNAFNDEVIADFRQEVSLAEVFAPVSIDLDSSEREPAEVPQAAFDYVDALAPDDTIDSIDMATDLVDDFSSAV
jgi:hypothetical protein